MQQHARPAATILRPLWLPDRLCAATEPNLRAAARNNADDARIDVPTDQVSLPPRPGDGVGLHVLCLQQTDLDWQLLSRRPSPASRWRLQVRSADSESRPDDNPRSPAFRPPAYRGTAAAGQKPFRTSAHEEQSSLLSPAGTTRPGVPWPPPLIVPKRNLTEHLTAIFQRDSAMQIHRRRLLASTK